LLGLVVGALFFLWRATGRQKIAFLCIVPAAVVILVSLAPKDVLRRIVAFSETDAAAESVAGEAAESTEMRKDLFKKSIEYTLEHPIVGVGIGQFASYEGMHNVLPGMTHGMWHNAHNTYTQVSSECGLPALAFYAAAILAAFRLLNRIYRDACKRPDCHDIRTMAFCVMMALTAFCVTIIFLNFAYICYMPVTTVFAGVIARAVPAELRARAAAADTASAPETGRWPLAGWGASRTRQGVTGPVAGSVRR
jgi:O-antigen ligase